MLPDERRLNDILACADELERFLADKTCDDFLGDAVLQRAAERLLTIIGEAAKNLSEATRQVIDQPWREIIRFRDKGIHGYNSLTPTTVYDLATVSAPALRDAVASYLKR